MEGRKNAVEGRLHRGETTTGTAEKAAENAPTELGVRRSASTPSEVVVNLNASSHHGADQYERYLQETNRDPLEVAHVNGPEREAKDRVSSKVFFSLFCNNPYGNPSSETFRSAMHVRVRVIVAHFPEYNTYDCVQESSWGLLRENLCSYFLKCKGDPASLHNAEANVPLGGLQSVKRCCPLAGGLDAPVPIPNVLDILWSW